MTLVFQQSIKHSAILNTWRLVHVTPLYKGKGDKTLSVSYRPISLTDVACKLLERLIVNQIRQYLAHHGLLCKEQQGFVSHQSTVSNLL